MPPPPPDLMPVVTVRATDARASWAGDTGTFTLFRVGPTNATLNIYYLTGGTAVSGVDYRTLGNLASIPAGARTSSITVKPIDTGLTVTRTVELKLVPSPLMPPVNYLIGYPSNAVVSIGTSATNNFPPMARLVTPVSGATFPSGSDVSICAAAADVDGYVRTVEFFAGTLSLGITTNNPLSTGPMNPFCLVWSNAPAGTYSLHALATDNGGASASSAPVNITVGTMPETNFPPLVRITSPPNGAIFPQSATIPLYAYATDRDDAVAAVEFFAGANTLGFGSNLCAVVSPPPLNCPSNVTVLMWSNAPLGTYSVRAKATDDRGASTTSSPISITVVAPPPPLTNRPPLVNIVAVDPVAIEGTNCWSWLGLTNTTPTWMDWGRGFFRPFTNCGPKNATFLVRRAGATNDALTVAYGIGGTATNGIDYVPLSGTVTIPAGERGARITIVPLDDGIPERTRTVVLRLEGSTAQPAEYLLGYPRSAAAMIVDSLRPQRGTTVLSDQSFHLNASGPDGAWYRVEFSTDMHNWTGVCTNQVINGSIDFVDPDAVSDQARFYRAVPELAPAMP